MSRHDPKPSPTGIVLLCRFNSSRLPGKILMPLARKPVLQHILDRLGSLDLPICIATSNETSDQPIVDYCNEHNLYYFRGDLPNVALRFLNCALHMKVEYAVRITGDSVFIDPAIVRQLVTIAKTNVYDLVSNRNLKMYPIGQTVEVMKVETFRNYYPQFSTPDDFEHVTQFFYRNEKALPIKIFHATNPDGNQRCVSMAIDTPEDFARAEAVIEKMGTAIQSTTYLDIIKNL
jgi:spore coat polysaccharide biosynthesis protein SpsF